jgi:hypothetical protein
MSGSGAPISFTFDSPGIIMRTVTYLLVSSFVFAVLVSACSDNNTVDADPFDTLQACFDEHTMEESLPVNNAIVVCCTDHPIAGVHPSCKDTQVDCVAHLHAELTLTSTVTDAVIEAACTDYLSKK